jgi:hypothetical protein
MKSLEYMDEWSEAKWVVNVTIYSDCKALIEVINKQGLQNITSWRERSCGKVC